MAYFARKLRYGAYDGEAGASYIALLELAKKKGGRPVGFVLYRRIMQYFYPNENRNEMIRIEAETSEDAIKRFWPLDEESAGKEFPGHRSDRWEKTTLWLDCVAVGGGYEQFRPGTWVRVGTPSPWLKRRKKKPLQFGNLGHILFARQTQLRALEEEKKEFELESELKLSELEGYDDESDCSYVPQENKVTYAQVEEQTRKQIEKIEGEMRAVPMTISNIKAEMRCKVRRMFPKPAGRIPRRVLRAQFAKGSRATFGW